MEKQKKMIGSVCLSAWIKQSEYIDFLEYHICFGVDVKNKQGDTLSMEVMMYSHDDKVNLEISEWDFIVDCIYRSWFMTSEAYGNFEDFCYDFGYDETNPEVKLFYLKNIQLGDNLQKILSKEWIDFIEMYFLLKKG